jgi:hypothetical protein
MMAAGAFDPVRPHWAAVEPTTSSAWHEAGHALVGHLVGLDVTESEIHAAGRSGQTTSRRGAADPVGELVMTASGWVADRLAFVDHELVRDRATRDRQQARRLAAWLDPRRPDGLVIGADAIARGLLERHSAALSHVAAELLAHRRLVGPRMIATLEAALQGVATATWLSDRRRAAETAGREGGQEAFAAAWWHVTGRWHGAAREETAELYAVTWRARETDRVDRLVAARRVSEGLLLTIAATHLRRAEPSRT